jgi:hypothetical protein
MRLNLRTSLFASGLAVLVSAAQPASASSIVTEWLDQTIPAAKQTAWEPTVGARFFALVHAAMYDAWAAYDRVAVGVFTGTALRGTGGPSTVVNKREAVSYAAYEVLRELAPPRRRALAAYMAELGYETNATSAPAKAGRRAAQAVLAAARQDGANQEAGYRDTTGYRVADPPTASSWQPTDDLGALQLPVSPQWSRVMTFALRSADEFRPPTPPVPGSAEWDAQIRELEEKSANLSDEQKAAAEFWVPWGSSPAVQLMEFTKYISARDDLRIDDEVKLFFLTSMALHDTAVAVWDAKYQYDYIRPITVVRALGDIRLQAWQPRHLPVAFAYSAPATRDAPLSVPAQGNAIAEIAAKDWQPYLATPAFPAYVSGHSAFTAAWARMMELVTARPEFGMRVAVSRLYVEQRLLDHPIEFVFPTLWSAAESSGQSRIYGGIHWPADNRHGLALGKAVAEQAWQRGQQLFLGTASPFAPALSNLTSAYWHVKTSGQAGHAGARGRLEAELAPGENVVWQSITFDAPPEGTYRMRVAVELEGATAGTMQASVHAAADPSIFLGASELILGSGGPQALTVDWHSDGSTPCQIEFQSSVASGAGRVAFKDIKSWRQWPVVEGVPRYREMSDLVLSK